MPVRAFAATSVISRGSSRGVTEARVTAYAFCSTSTPNAAGRSSTTSLCSTASTIPQHSRPRAISVPASRYRRPCCARSSIGPITGARTANGAMVMIRVSAIRPRAWSSEVLKNSVPARAMVTKASPAAPAAVSSMRLARPVRPAPEAPVMRCTMLLVPARGPRAGPAAGLGGRGHRPGRLPGRRPGPIPSHGPSILCQAGPTKWRTGPRPPDLAASWCEHAPGWGTITEREPTSSPQA